MSLLMSRRLGPLLVTQALGAINDNLFKNALVVLILFKAAASSGPVLVAAAGGVFILPYMLLSTTAGQVADRFEKARTILVLKWVELALMAAAAAGFVLESTPLLFAVLLGLGIQATFFGPLKNAILPSVLAENELVAGNGLVEAGTFLGILVGTIAGSALVAGTHGPLVIAGLGLVLAVLGIVSAAFVPRAPSDAPDLRIGANILLETVRLLRMARARRPVWLCILGLAWFWTVGATLLTELPTLVRRDLGASEHVFTLMLAFFSVGVAAGSTLCSKLLHGQVSARLVPFAAAALSVFLWDFARTIGGSVGMPGLTTVPGLLQSVTGWRILLDLALLAACGGIYSVPLYAVIQERAETAVLARMMAANNVVNAAGMAGAAVVTAVLAAWGLAPTTVLLIAAGLNLAVAFWIIRIIPQDTVRALVRWYFTALHGVDVAGLETLPDASTRMVIVSNHQSFLDGCFLGAFLPGAPTFAVNVHIARLWWARPFLAAVRIFTVDPANPFATKAMVKAVKDGQTLVIFPEGRLTTTGLADEGVRRRGDGGGQGRGGDRAGADRWAAVHAAVAHGAPDAKAVVPAAVADGAAGVDAGAGPGAARAGAAPGGGDRAAGGDGADGVRHGADGADAVDGAAGCRGAVWDGDADHRGRGSGAGDVSAADPGGHGTGAAAGA